MNAWNDFNSTSGGFISGANKYRIVSSGFVLRSIVAPLNASGMVSLRNWGGSPATMQSVDALAYTSTSSVDTPLRLVNEMAAVTSHSSAMPQTFYEVQDDAPAVANLPNSGFNPMTIYVYGAPASADVLVMEYVIHYEIIFPDSNALALAATNAPVASSVLTQSANRVTSAIPAFIERGTKALGDVIIKSATRALGAYLGGPSGAMIGSHAAAIMVD